MQTRTTTNGAIKIDSEMMKRNAGKIVAGVGLLMAVIAMGVNTLAEMEFSQDLGVFGTVTYTYQCRWDEMEVESGSFSTSFDYDEAVDDCGNTDTTTTTTTTTTTSTTDTDVNIDCDDLEGVQAAGAAWLAFGIIGILLVSAGMVLQYVVPQLAWLEKVAYACGAGCFFLCFVVWAAKGCTQLDFGSEEFELGSSWYLMLLACLLIGGAAFLEWFLKRPVPK
jgi:hypothetical protein